MIGVYIQLGSMSEDQYHALDDAVKAAGVSEAGCMLHTCFKEGPNLAVFDVWDSKENFERFIGELGGVAAGLGMTEAPQTSYVEMVTYEPR
jgi:hypothetical protein